MEPIPSTSSNGLTNIHQRATTNKEITNKFNPQAWDPFFCPFKCSNNHFIAQLVNYKQ